MNFSRLMSVCVRLLSDYWYFLTRKLPLLLFSGVLMLLQGKSMLILWNQSKILEVLLISSHPCMYLENVSAHLLSLFFFNSCHKQKKYTSIIYSGWTCTESNTIGLKLFAGKIVRFCWKTFSCWKTELAQLTGIAAILRFPLPDLEDIEMWGKKHRSNKELIMFMLLYTVS